MKRPLDVQITAFRREVGQRLGAGLQREAGWLVGGTAIQAGVAFAANLVLVRVLLPEDFGRFAIVQANALLASTFINFKLDDLVVRMPESELTHRRLGAYGAALVVQSVLVLLVGSTVLWSVGLLTPEALLLLGVVVATDWLALHTRLYERGFDYRGLSAVETGSHLGGHLFAVVGALAGLGGAVLYLREAARLVGQVIGLWRLRALRKIPLRWPRLVEWKEMVAQIRSLWVDGVLEQSFERVVILVVGALTGERTTGYFFQARRLAVTPHQLLQPVAQRMAFNLFSRIADAEAKRRVLVRGLAACFGILILVGGAILLWADPVVPWIFGPGWEPVVPLLMAMVGVVVGLTPFTLLQAHFMATARMRPLLIVGRGGQYVVFGAAALTMGVISTGSAVGLALGFSGAYVASVLALLPSSLRRDG